MIYFGKVCRAPYIGMLLWDCVYVYIIFTHRKVGKNNSKTVKFRWQWRFSRSYYVTASSPVDTIFDKIIYRRSTHWIRPVAFFSPFSASHDRRRRLAVLESDNNTVLVCVCFIRGNPEIISKRRVSGPTCCYRGG